METILSYQNITIAALVLFIVYGIIKTNAPTKYIIYLETFDIDIAWFEYSQRVKQNPASHGLQIHYADGKYIVRKVVTYV